MEQEKKLKKEFVEMVANKAPQHIFGGHISWPPEGCLKEEFIFEHEGIPWLDCSICHKCQEINTCERRKEWKKENKRQG